MPYIHPLLNKTPGQQAPADGSSAAATCNANEVLQSAIQGLKTEVRNSLILRCDELPFVQADKKMLGKAFSQIVQLIVDQKDAATKLYLHISAAVDPVERTGLSLPEGFTPCLIQFHTNITPCNEWMKTAVQQISNITVLLGPFGGNLLVNPLKNSGCIFSVSLPGKL